MVTVTGPVSIFSQSWWLDAVAPGQWDEVRVEKSGELHARLPYVIRHDGRKTILRMPQLTQSLGPWLRPYPGKYAGRLAEEKELMMELIRLLPPHHIFQQNFHYSITNWLPFYWAGFEQTTRYTYTIDNLTDPKLIWQDMEKNIRTDIRKAEKALVVREDLGLDQFMPLHRMVFSRQGKALPYPPELVERIDQACSERGCRKIFFAEDSKGRLHAAVYIIWDDLSAYYLMGGGDPELRNSGATSLCMWEAIKFASTVTRRFDFEGSMIEPVEKYFRAFGAVQKPFFRVWKFNSAYSKIMNDIKSWRKKR